MRTGLSRLKVLWQTIIRFLKEDFHAFSYGYTLSFLLVCCSINYYWSLDDDYLEPLMGTWEGKVLYFLFYGFAWFGVAIPLLVKAEQWQTLKNSAFWFRSLFLIGFIAIEGGMGVGETWIEMLGFEESQYWARRTFRQWQSILIWIPVYFLFMKTALPAFKDGLFGIRWKLEDLKPYLAMLWVMIPLIFMASFLPDFQEQYPVFKRIIPYLPVNEGAGRYIYLGLFEVSYLLSFIVVELMFRGGLVLGMADLLGRRAVLPMVSIYMFLHFGKPVGESISSVFGGYILAVLAFQNRNIWGGIFIHACVAFLMDFAAFWQLKSILFP